MQEMKQTATNACEMLRIMPVQPGSRADHHIDRTQRKTNTNAEEIPSTFPARCMMRSQSEI